jgi:hypothetical protein
VPSLVGVRERSGKLKYLNKGSLYIKLYKPSFIAKGKYNVQ